MDDALALLVGKVILAYAKLDQTLWGQIGHLAVAKRDLDRAQGQIRTTTEEADDRFSRRLKHFRRLSSELTSNNQMLMSEIDRTLQEIRDIERIRAHLAHGWLSLSEDWISVLDHREGRDFFRAIREADFISVDIDALHKRHIDINYRRDDIAITPLRIRNADVEICRLTTEILLALRR